MKSYAKPTKEDVRNWMKDRLTTPETLPTVPEIREKLWGGNEEEDLDIKRKLGFGLIPVGYRNTFKTIK